MSSLEPLDIEVSLLDALLDAPIGELRQQHDELLRAFEESRRHQERLAAEQNKINETLAAVAQELSSKLAKVEGQMVAFAFECGKLARLQDSQPRVVSRKRVRDSFVPTEGDAF